MLIWWYTMIYDDIWWYKDMLMWRNEDLANPVPGNHCVPHSLSETRTQPPTTLIVMDNVMNTKVMTCLIFSRQQRRFKTYWAVYLAWGSVEDGDCHQWLLKTNITMIEADYDNIYYNDWRILWWQWLQIVLQWRWLEQTSPILLLAFATLSRGRGGSATQANKLGLEPISYDFHCFHMCLVS